MFVFGACASDETELLAPAARVEAARVEEGAELLAADGETLSALAAWVRSDLAAEVFHVRWNAISDADGYSIAVYENSAVSTPLLEAEYAANVTSAEVPIPFDSTKTAYWFETSWFDDSEWSGSRFHFHTSPRRTVARTGNTPPQIRPVPACFGAVVWGDTVEIDPKRLDGLFFDQEHDDDLTHEISVSDTTLMTVWKTNGQWERLYMLGHAQDEDEVRVRVTVTATEPQGGSVGNTWSVRVRRFINAPISCATFVTSTPTTPSTPPSRGGGNGGGGERGTLPVTPPSTPPANPPGGGGDPPGGGGDPPGGGGNPPPTSGPKGSGGPPKGPKTPSTPVANRPPVVVGMTGTFRLVEGARKGYAAYAFRSLFSDPDGDDFTVSVSSADATVLSVGSKRDCKSLIDEPWCIDLTAEAVGTTTLTATAVDDSSASASATFTVEVFEYPKCAADGSDCSPPSAPSISLTSSEARTNYYGDLYAVVYADITWSDDHGTGPNGDYSTSKPIISVTVCALDDQGAAVGDECYESGGSSWLLYPPTLREAVYFEEGVETLNFTISVSQLNFNLNQSLEPEFHLSSVSSVTASVSRP